MNNRALRAFAVAALLTTLSGAPTLAGPYADDLSKCLVSSTTAKDKTGLVRWIFATAALHPDVSNIASITDKQRTEMARTVGQLFERLLTEACRPQFRDAMKYEGDQTIEMSFGLLGGVAMKGLMEDPTVAKGFEALETYVNQDKINAATQPDEP